MDIRKFGFDITSWRALKQLIQKVKMNLTIRPLTDSNNIPFDLLELADPSKQQIDSYLKSGTCYVAEFESEIIGLVVLSKVDSKTIEIKNIAVKESEQGKGYGKALLNFSEKESVNLGFDRIIIGTGNSSIGQLALYQKSGFELHKIDKNFFVRNYNEPIYENGIQCKHMVLLEKKLIEL